MLRKRCDNCNRMIETADDLAGQKVACEACGDINIMPTLSSPTDKPAAPEATGSSAQSESQRTSQSAKAAKIAELGLPPDSGPEQTVHKIYPAMFRAKPFKFLGLMMLVALGITGCVWGGLLGDHSTARSAALIAGALAALIGLGALAVWKIQTLGAAIEITNKRTVLRTGLLSKATSEVVHDNIRNVQVSQTFLQRLLGVGTLGLSSSGQDGIEIQIDNIPKPDHIRRIIDLYRPLG